MVDTNNLQKSLQIQRKRIIVVLLLSEKIMRPERGSVKSDFC